MTQKISQAFCLGILFGLQILVFWWKEFFFIWWFVLLFIVCEIFFSCKYKKREILVFIIGTLLGLTRFFFWHPDPPEIIETFYEQQVEFTGKISSFPEKREDIVQYDATLHSINGTQISRGQVRITSPHYLEIKRGQEIAGSGKFEEPFESEEFSYKNYLARKSIYGTMITSQIEIKKEEGFFWRNLGGLRYTISKHIQKVYNFPYGGFLEGLLLGRKYGLSDEVSATFQETGLTHIIAISGYNITLIIMIIGQLFSFLGRYGKIIISSIAVVLFTLLVGAEASVVRACLMGLVGLLGMMWGRQNFVWSSLLWAMVFMVFYEPRTFLFDVGFQLSVVATIGVVWLGKKVSKVFSFLPNELEIRESFSLTIAAQITTLPLLIYYFNSISFVSPFANVLVAPFLPWAMLSGFIELMLSFIPILSHIIVFITQSILMFTIFLATIAQKLPYAYVEVSQIPTITIIIFYFILFKVSQRKKKIATS